MAAYRTRRGPCSRRRPGRSVTGPEPTVWSGRPNPQLVAEVTGLPPGRALDVGSGEGADAVWLAERGWQVTAVDISTTALERAAAHAEAAGAGRRPHRVDARGPARQAARRGRVRPGVVAVHAPAGEPRRELFARLAAAVAPGGTLLIVGHHPSDLRTTARRMHMPDMMFTAEEVAASLDPTKWEVLAAEARPRGGDRREDARSPSTTPSWSRAAARPRSPHASPPRRSWSRGAGMVMVHDLCHPPQLHDRRRRGAGGPAETWRGVGRDFA